MSPLAVLRDYEATYNAQVLIDWTAAHAEVPIFAVVLYLGMVFYLPDLIREKLPLRPLLLLWNLALAVFSMLGASRVVPLLLENLFAHDFKYTVCTDPADWYLRGGAGLWTGLFIYSKFPELLDTAFLVLTKKKVIFLHWFHHATVLLYCWHSFSHRIGPGLWFAAMNYSVHSVMYLYYFLAIGGYKTLARPIAPYITTVQLLQMVVGMAVSVKAAIEFGKGGKEQCYTDAANVKLGLAMYFSYFLLFAVLYYNNYLSKDKRHKNEPRRNVCDVGDAAGFFHGDKAPAADSPTNGEKKRN